MASQDAASSAVAARIDTPQRPVAMSGAWKRLWVSTQTSTRGGSSETLVNALAVMAWSIPSCKVLTTVTPLAKRPSAARKAASSSGAGTCRA